MAYMNKEKKAGLAPKIKAVLKRYGMKGTISVRHYSELVVTLRAGDLNFAGNDINEFWIEEHFKEEPMKRDFLLELVDAMNKGDGVENYNKSDPMTDYFNVGWYIRIKVAEGYKYSGKFNPPPAPPEELEEVILYNRLVAVPEKSFVPFEW